MNKLLLLLLMSFGLTACTEKKPSNYEHVIAESPNTLPADFTQEESIIEVPIYIFVCGDLMITDETTDKSSNDEIVIEVPIYIALEPDDPRCIEAKKSDD